MFRSTVVSLILLTGLFGVSSSFAQSSLSAIPASQKLLVTAISKNSSPAELSVNDFELKQNGKPANVSAIRKLGRLPLHYCVVFDISGSEKATFRFQQEEAGAVLAKIIEPGTDRGWISVFKARAQESEEVNDPQKLEDFISRLTPPTPAGTALYDAMVDCGLRMAKLQEAPDANLRIAFVFSDGDDDASNLSLNQTIGRLTEAAVRVVAFTPRPDIDHEGRRALNLLARSTGGRVFTPTDNNSLQQALDQLALDLRNLYEISYNGASDKKGKTKVELKCRDKSIVLLAPTQAWAVQF